MITPRLPRLGLRARVTVLFSAGALAVSVALASATYGVTRSNLVEEREQSAVRAASFDAAVVGQGLTAEDADLNEVLRAVDTGQGRQPLIRQGGEFFGRGADPNLTTAVPPALLALVEGGQSAAQRVEVDGDVRLVVGVPLPDVAVTYFEVGSLDDLDDTLRSLGTTLLLVSALTTLAGLGLGLWAGQRLLRPLTSVSTAAEAIIAGDLSARLHDTTDPDLQPITVSFNTMVDQLSVRLERDRRFAADVSHELRSPLQTLMAASSVLVRRTGEMEPRTAAAAELIAEEVARFTELVQDLLELARDEAPLTRRPTDVPALLTDLSRDVVRPGGLDLHAAPPSWPLDRKRVERLVSNLLDNARRHGGGATRLAAWSERDRLVIEVDDEGPGVPVEERLLVFDRFGRGRAASARGGSDGTGLGLSLVQQHSVAHGGTVTVIDRPGGGARFRVELPSGSP